MLDIVISPLRGGFWTKMATIHSDFVFVLCFLSFAGYVFSSSTDQKVAMLEKNFSL